MGAVVEKSEGIHVGNGRKINITDNNENIESMMFPQDVQARQKRKYVASCVKCFLKKR